MFIDLSTFISLGLIFLSIAYLHRQKTTDFNSFHISSWSAKPFAVVASIVALFGAGEISTFTELYTQLGSGILVFFFGVAAGFMTLYVFRSNVHSELQTIKSKKSSPAKAYHINDVVFDRYGRIVSLSFTTLAVISLMAIYLIQVIVGSELIAIGSGIKYEYAVIGISIFIALYVGISGLEGIYGTDKIQVIALFVGLSVIAFYATGKIDLNYKDEYSRIFSNLDLTTGLTLFFPGFFAVVGADVLQRIISSKAEKDLKKITLAAAVGWVTLGVIIVAFAAGVASYSEGDAPGFIAFIGDAEGIVRVIVIVALVSALLSTADTEAHSVALLINRAVNPEGNPSVLLSRFLIAGICLLGGVIAISFNDLVTLYSIMLNIFLILGPIIFAIIFKRGNAISVGVTLIVSSCLLVYFAYSDLVVGTSHLFGLEILLLFIITSINFIFKNRGSHYAS